MKKLILLPFLLVFSGIVMLSFADSEIKEYQRIERHIIMFKIIGNITFDDVQKIDAKLSTKDGIIASRTNAENNIYFSYTLKSKNLTKENFEAWFKELGYEISCFDKVVEGEGISKTWDEFKNC